VGNALLDCAPIDGFADGADAIMVFFRGEPRKAVIDRVFCGASGRSQRPRSERHCHQYRRVLEWVSDPINYFTGPKEMATITRSFDDAFAHDEERCGPVARTDVGVTIRRTAVYSLQKHHFEQRITSVRERYGDLESLTEAVGLRI
jgi:hypothetical protein